MLCHSGKLRTVVWAASTTKDSFIETRKGEQTAQACANACLRQLASTETTICVPSSASRKFMDLKQVTKALFTFLHRCSRTRFHLAGT